MELSRNYFFQIFLELMNSFSLNNRLTKEASEFKSDILFDNTYEWAIPIQTDKMLWCGFIKGPSDTVYEGGIYEIDIVITPNYPFEPPKMKFRTKIYHPNISSATGAICLDILKDQWTPALCIRTLLVSLQALLSSPQPRDPQDYVVALQMDTNYEQFKVIAVEWVQTYATLDKTSIESFITQTCASCNLKTRDQAIAFLRESKWDVSSLVVPKSLQTDKSGLR